MGRIMMMSSASVASVASASASSPRGRRAPSSNNGRCLSIDMVLITLLSIGVVVTLLPHHGHSYQMMRMSRPPQSIISSSSSSSYSTAVFMSTTESMTSQVESTNGSGSGSNINSNMSNSDTTHDNNMYPPLTTKEAAPDILALVNDAASASPSSSDVVSPSSVDGGNSNKVGDYNGETNNGIDVDEFPPPTSAKEVALDILALENDAAAASASSSTGGIPIYYSDGSNGVGNNGGLPFAPMMTYQKYLTMQEKRVKVTIRYSAEAGLRPFYLTVANEIKSAHPDVLLEKRILPRVGGGDEAVFEVIVDGRTIIGKKKTRMLKVSSSISSSSRGGGSKSSSSSSMSNGDEDDDDIVVGGNISEEREDNRRSSTPDIAGGRTVFIGMERLAAELTKARKKRRPNTTYRSGSMREDALEIGAGVNTAETAQSSKMTEAVIRLERLKAMGGARNKV